MTNDRGQGESEWLKARQSDVSVWDLVKRGKQETRAWNLSLRGQEVELCSSWQLQFLCDTESRPSRERKAWEREGLVGGREGGWVERGAVVAAAEGKILSNPWGGAEGFSPGRVKVFAFFSPTMIAWLSLTLRSPGGNSSERRQQLTSQKRRCCQSFVQMEVPSL